MEKIALIGDAHFDRKAENPIIKKNIKEGQLKFYDFVAEELKRQGVNTIWWTGDIHDNRNNLDVMALVNTKRLFKNTFKNFDIHIILGNHDMYYENSYEYSSLELFEDIENVTVYRDKPVKKSFLGKDVYFFPWITQDREENLVKYLTALAGKPKEKINNTILFGHFEMLDIKMEGNSISTFGLDKNLFLTASRLVLSGHYHGKSYLKSGDNELYYLGSPYPMTFANADQQHGIWLLDENMNMEFIENTISPNFVDVWDKDIEKIEDMNLTNSFVRLYISDDKSVEDKLVINLKIEAKHPLKINKIPYKGDPKDIEEKTEIERSANELLSMDTLKLSEVYIEQNQETLPTLQLNTDTKQVVLEKIKTYKRELNLD